MTQHNRHTFHWPKWFPYPSSWLRTLALLLWIAVVLRITGFWSLVLGGTLAVITERLELLLSFLGLGLIVSVLVLSYLHHFLFGKSPPQYPEWLPSPSSLWEGFYAPIVMLVAFVPVLIILVPFLIPNCSYTTPERIEYCLELTGRELANYEYGMAQIGAFIWFTSALYLYQAEYLIRQRVALKSNVVSKLTKKLLLILLIPLVALGIYSFSKLLEFKETVPAPIAAQLPSVTQPPIASASPTTAPQLDSFTNAVNKAMNAATTTQSATFQDDWLLVVSQWQEAIALMKAVPSSHSKYTVAQQKVIEYQRNLNYAQNNAAAASQ